MSAYRLVFADHIDGQLKSIISDINSIADFIAIWELGRYAVREL